MAAPLPNEEEIREGIQSGRYALDQVILNALDLILSDYLMAMILSMKDCIEENVPMDADRARVLLGYSRSMNNVFSKVMHPEKIGPGDNDLLQNIKKAKPPQMDKDIRVWLTHHIGNDCQVINFIIGDYADERSPIPASSLQEKVLSRTDGIRDVLGALLAPVKRRQT